MSGAPPPTQYSIYFSQTGLSNGQLWSVTLYTSPGGPVTTESSNSPGNNGNTITFSEPDGTYLYAISPPAGFLPEPSLGAVTVPGNKSPLTVNISFGQSATASATTSSGSGGSITYISNGNFMTVQSNQNNVIQVPSGMQIFLTAKPDSQHVFQDWTTTGSITISGSVSPSAILTVTGTGSVTANFASNLVVAITPLAASIQPGGSTVFTATAAGGSGGYSYVWTWQQFGSGANLQHGTGTGNPYTFTPPSIGTYEVYATVTDSSGNSNPSLFATVTVQSSVTPSNSQTLTVIAEQTNVYNLPPNDLTIIVPGGCQAVSGQQFDPNSAGCVGSSIQLPSQTPIATRPSSSSSSNTLCPFDESIEVQLSGNAPLTIQASSLALQATSVTFLNGKNLPGWADESVQCSLVNAGSNTPYTGSASPLTGTVTLEPGNSWLTNICQVQWNIISTSNLVESTVESNAAGTLLGLTGVGGVTASVILQIANEANSLESNVILAAQINFGLSSAGLNAENVYVTYSIVPYTIAAAPGPKWSAFLWWVGEVVGSVAVTGGLDFAGAVALTACLATAGVTCVIAAGLFASEFVIGTALDLWAQDQLADP